MQEVKATLIEKDEYREASQKINAEVDTQIAKLNLEIHNLQASTNATSQGGSQENSSMDGLGLGDDA